VTQAQGLQPGVCVRLLVLVVAAVGMLGGAARADAPPTAESLYDEGQAAYEKADYAIAIAKWQESYRLSNENGLLFNLAQAQRLSGNCGAALATYWKFLAVDQDPASEQHKLADDFARELGPTCGAAKAPPVDPKPQVTVEDHDRHSGLRLVGLIGGGSGIVALATGLALGHHGQTLGNDVTVACAVNCDWAVQKGKDASGRGDVAIGYALDVAGAAAIAGSAIAYYIGVRRGGLTITPRPSDGGAAISWSGSW
jgi:tetratricopeptide (TPR) repeat protein